MPMTMAVGRITSALLKVSATFILLSLCLGEHYFDLNYDNKALHMFNITDYPRLNCRQSIRTMNNNHFITQELRHKICQLSYESVGRTFKTQFNIECFRDEAHLGSRINPCFVLCAEKHERNYENRTDCDNFVKYSETYYLLIDYPCGPHHICDNTGCCVEMPQVVTTTQSTQSVTTQSSSLTPLTTDPNTETTQSSTQTTLITTIDPNTETTQPSTQTNPITTTNSNTETTQTSTQTTLITTTDLNTETTQSSTQTTLITTIDPNTETTQSSTLTTPITTTNPNTETTQPSTLTTPITTTNPNTETTQSSTLTTPITTTNPNTETTQSSTLTTPITTTNPNTETTQPSTQTTPPPITFKCSKPGRFQDPYDKTKYYECQYEAKIERCEKNQIFFQAQRECLFDPSIFDPELGFDRWYRSIRCTKVGIFRSPYNCHYFYTCIPSHRGYFLYVDYCFGNQVFNDTTKQCSYKKHRCNNRLTVP